MRAGEKKISTTSKYWKSFSKWYKDSHGQSEYKRFGKRGKVRNERQDNVEKGKMK